MEREEAVGIGVRMVPAPGLPCFFTIKSLQGLDRSISK